MNRRRASQTKPRQRDRSKRKQGNARTQKAGKQGQGRTRTATRREERVLGQERATKEKRVTRQGPKARAGSTKYRNEGARGQTQGAEGQRQQGGQPTGRRRGRKEDGGRHAKTGGRGKRRGECQRQAGRELEVSKTRSPLSACTTQPRAFAAHEAGCRSPRRLQTAQACYQRLCLARSRRYKELLRESRAN